MNSPIPEDVFRFVQNRIDSVEQLEILLLLHGSPELVWSPERVAQALYSNIPSVSRRLETLRAYEILTLATTPSGYRYQPASPALDTTINRLAETYRQRRVAIITLIASKPMDNVRAFSEAFRLRKKDQDS